MSSRIVTYSYSNIPDSVQHRTSLSVVPKLSSTANYISLRVCRSFRDRRNTKYVTIFKYNTLEELKQKIWRESVSLEKPSEFSLNKYDENEGIWTPIGDTNARKTIADLNLSDFTILNVEPFVENNTSSRSTPKVKDISLTLKLCKRPMDKTDCHHIDTHSSITVHQLREEARTRTKYSTTNRLYLWENDEWTELDPNVDDLTLAEMRFIDYSIISFETEDDFIPGVCGLTNLGNTCFMNSALQCLSNIPKLTKKILSFDNDMNAPIIGDYSALIKMMWSGKHIVTTPSSLLVNIRENLPRFARYRQQDAQEFMNYFLHLIHQELTSENTLITKLFYGQIRSSVKCLGRCESVESHEETISFLPLPVENDLDQYNLLYLRTNGEHSFVTVHACRKTPDTLIDVFVKQHDPSLSFKRIQLVRMVNNRIKDTYSSYTSLDDRFKHQWTFIEVPEKTVEQKYVELVFLTRHTNEPFRPSIFLICPSYDCCYSHLSDQIDQIKNYLCSATSAPTWACYFSWINYDGNIRQLNEETKKSDILYCIDRFIIEMDSHWTKKYTNQYNFDPPTLKPSLNTLLTDFFHEDPLDGDYYCSTCLCLTKAKQKTDLALPLPPVLIIQLKRFTYDTYSNEKIDTYIDFPLQDLDLREYISHDDKQNKDISTLYNLVAVSNHTGSLVCGHYTTYAKNDGNKKWYSFNDDRCREIDEKDIVTKNAYILVYVKRSAV